MPPPPAAGLGPGAAAGRPARFPLAASAVCLLNLLFCLSLLCVYLILEEDLVFPTPALSPHKIVSQIPAKVLPAVVFVSNPFSPSGHFEPEEGPTRHLSALPSENGVRPVGEERSSQWKTDRQDSATAAPLRERIPSADLSPPQTDSDVSPARSSARPGSQGSGEEATVTDEWRKREGAAHVVSSPLGSANRHHPGGPASPEEPPHPSSEGESEETLSESQGRTKDAAEAPTGQMLKAATGFLHWFFQKADDLPLANAVHRRLKSLREMEAAVARQRTEAETNRKERRGGARNQRGAKRRLAEEEGSQREEGDASTAGSDAAESAREGSLPGDEDSERGFFEGDTSERHAGGLDREGCTQQGEFGGGCTRRSSSSERQQGVGVEAEETGRLSSLLPTSFSDRLSAEVEAARILDFALSHGVIASLLHGESRGAFPGARPQGQEKRGEGSKTDEGGRNLLLKAVARYLLVANPSAFPPPCRWEDDNGFGTGEAGAEGAGDAASRSAGESSPLCFDAAALFTPSLTRRLLMPTEAFSASLSLDHYLQTLMFHHLDEMPMTPPPHLLNQRLAHSVSAFLLPVPQGPADSAASAVYVHSADGLSGQCRAEGGAAHGRVCRLPGGGGRSANNSPVTSSPFSAAKRFDDAKPVRLAGNEVSVQTIADPKSNYLYVLVLYGKDPVYSSAFSSSPERMPVRYRTRLVVYRRSLSDLLQAALLNRPLRRAVYRQLVRLYPYRHLADLVGLSFLPALASAFSAAERRRDSPEIGTRQPLADQNQGGFSPRDPREPSLSPLPRVSPVSSLSNSDPTPESPPPSPSLFELAPTSRASPLTSLPAFPESAGKLTGAFDSRVSMLSPTRDAGNVPAPRRSAGAPSPVSPPRSPSMSLHLPTALASARRTTTREEARRALEGFERIALSAALGAGVRADREADADGEETLFSPAVGPLPPQAASVPFQIAQAAVERLLRFPPGTKRGAHGEDREREARDGGSRHAEPAPAAAPRRTPLSSSFSASDSSLSTSPAVSPRLQTTHLSTGLFPAPSVVNLERHRLELAGAVGDLFAPATGFALSPFLRLPLVLAQISGELALAYVHTLALFFQEGGACAASLWDLLHACFDDPKSFYVSLHAPTFSKHPWISVQPLYELLHAHYGDIPGPRDAGDIAVAAHAAEDGQAARRARSARDEEQREETPRGELGAREAGERFEESQKARRSRRDSPVFTLPVVMHLGFAMALETARALWRQQKLFVSRIVDALTAPSAHPSEDSETSSEASQAPLRFPPRSSVSSSTPSSPLATEHILVVTDATGDRAAAAAAEAGRELVGDAAKARRRTRHAASRSSLPRAWRLAPMGALVRETQREDGHAPWQLFRDRDRARGASEDRSRANQERRRGRDEAHARYTNPRKSGAASLAASTPHTEYASAWDELMSVVVHALQQWAPLRHIGNVLFPSEVDDEQGEEGELEGGSTDVSREAQRDVDAAGSAHAGEKASMDEFEREGGKGEQGQATREERETTETEKGDSEEGDEASFSAGSDSERADDLSHLLPLLAPSGKTRASSRSDRSRLSFAKNAFVSPSALAASLRGFQLVRSYVFEGQKAWLAVDQETVSAAVVYGQPAGLDVHWKVTFFPHLDETAHRVLSRRRRRLFRSFVRRETKDSADGRGFVSTGSEAGQAGRERREPRPASEDQDDGRKEGVGRSAGIGDRQHASTENRRYEQGETSREAKNDKNGSPHPEPRHWRDRDLGVHTPDVATAFGIIVGPEMDDGDEDEGYGDAAEGDGDAADKAREREALPSGVSSLPLDEVRVEHAYLRHDESRPSSAADFPRGRRQAMASLVPPVSPVASRESDRDDAVLYDYEFATFSFPGAAAVETGSLSSAGLAYTRSGDKYLFRHSASLSSLLSHLEPSLPRNNSSSPASSFPASSSFPSSEVSSQPVLHSFVGPRVLQRENLGDVVLLQHVHSGASGGSAQTPAVDPSPWKQFPTVLSMLVHSTDHAVRYRVFHHASGFVSPSSALCPSRLNRRLRPQTPHVAEPTTGELSRHCVGWAVGRKAGTDHFLRVYQPGEGEGRGEDRRRDAKNDGGSASQGVYEFVRRPLWASAPNRRDFAFGYLLKLQIFRTLRRPASPFATQDEKRKQSEEAERLAEEERLGESRNAEGPWRLGTLSGGQRSFREAKEKRGSAPSLDGPSGASDDLAEYSVGEVFRDFWSYAPSFRLLAINEDGSCIAGVTGALGLFVQIEAASTHRQDAPVSSAVGLVGANEETLTETVVGRGSFEGGEGRERENRRGRTPTGTDKSRASTPVVREVDLAAAMAQAGGVEALEGRQVVGLSFFPLHRFLAAVDPNVIRPEFGAPGRILLTLLLDDGRLLLLSVHPDATVAYPPRPFFHHLLFSISWNNLVIFLYLVLLLLFHFRGQQLLLVPPLFNDGAPTPVRFFHLFFAIVRSFLSLLLFPIVSLVLAVARALRFTLATFFSLGFFLRLVLARALLRPPRQTPPPAAPAAPAGPQQAEAPASPTADRGRQAQETGSDVAGAAASERTHAAGSAVSSEEAEMRGEWPGETDEERRQRLRQAREAFFRNQLRSRGDRQPEGESAFLSALDGDASLRRRHGRREDAKGSETEDTAVSSSFTPSGPGVVVRPDARRPLSPTGKVGTSSVCPPLSSSSSRTGLLWGVDERDGQLQGDTERLVRSPAAAFAAEAKAVAAKGEKSLSRHRMSSLPFGASASDSASTSRSLSTRPAPSTESPAEQRNSQLPDAPEHLLAESSLTPAATVSLGPSGPPSRPQNVVERRALLAQAALRRSLGASPGAGEGV